MIPSACVYYVCVCVCVCVVRVCVVRVCGVCVCGSVNQVYIVQCRSNVRHWTYHSYAHVRNAESCGMH